MSVPNTMMVGSLPYGLTILDDRQMRTDSEGITRATVRYVCYPPDALSYYRPGRGSGHPRYGGLSLDTCDVRVENGLMFIDATYIGLLDGAQTSESSESHVRTGWWLGTNTDGSMDYKKYAITNTVHRTHVVTTGGAPAATEGKAVSYEKVGHLTRYTIEETTETRKVVVE